MKIENKLLQGFIERAADRLSGDWVILGGSVLHLLKIDVRITTDIDLAGPESATQKDTLILMDIAHDLGLPVEAINQAAGYFLFKIDGWEDCLVPVFEGRSARIMRPNATLFLKLKINRLNESDLTDCMAMLDYAEANSETIETKSLLQSISKQKKGESNSNRLHRLKVLEKRLTSSKDS